MKKKPQSQTVTIVILGKEYRIVCEEEERDALLQSAHDLDKQMRAIRDTGKVNSPDRIAVMAALNLMHDLRQVKSLKLNPGKSFSERLIGLRNKIENALENS